MLSEKLEDLVDTDNEHIISMPTFEEECAIAADKIQQVEKHKGRHSTTLAN